MPSTLKSIPISARDSAAPEDTRASAGAPQRVVDSENPFLALSELPVDRNASGRFRSAGSSVSFERSAPTSALDDSIHDLGLMLDEALVDELFLARRSAGPLPVEVALRPAPASPEILTAPTGSLRAMTPPSMTDPARAVRASRSRLEDLAPPPFMLEPPGTIKPVVSADALFETVAFHEAGPVVPAASPSRPHPPVPGVERASAGPAGPTQTCRAPLDQPIYANVNRARLASAGVPAGDTRFGFAIGDGGSGLGSSDGASDDDSLLQRVVQRLRIDEGIDRVRDWLWEMQPYLRGLASLVLPGWGQFQNEQPAKGRFFRASAFFTLAVADLLLFRTRVASLVSLVVEVEPFSIARWLAPVVLGGAFLWMVAVYDAYLVSRTRRECQTNRL